VYAAGAELEGVTAATGVLLEGVYAGYPAALELEGVTGESGVLDGGEYEK